MGLQLRRCLKRLAAQAAGMIFDARVDLQMNLQVARRAEQLRALLASERFLLRVRSCVQI